MKALLKHVLIASLFYGAIVVSSCAKVTEAEAKDAFLKANPTFTVIDIDAGEGWDGVVTYHYVYKKPNDDTKYEEAWTFVKKEDGSWKISKWIPKTSTGE